MVSHGCRAEEMPWLQFNLGAMNFEDRGVPQNDTEVQRCSGIASLPSREMPPRSPIWVTRMLEGRRVRSKRYRGFVRWYRPAAERGNAAAQVILGAAQVRSVAQVGVAQNDARGSCDGIAWLPSGGNAVAQSQSRAATCIRPLQVVVFRSKRYAWLRIALLRYRMAAEQGNALLRSAMVSAWHVAQGNRAEAQVESAATGMTLLRLRAAQVDAEAVRWYRMAAEQLNAEAVRWYGMAARALAYRSSLHRSIWVPCYCQRSRRSGSKRCRAPLNGIALWRSARLRECRGVSSSPL